MSLNWNISKIKDHDTLCKVRDETGNVIALNPVTDALIWYTMVLGVGDLTDKLIPEFYVRMLMYDKLFSSLLLGEDGPRPLTLDDVKAHEGLHTNVALETRSAWTKRMIDNFFREQSNALRSDQHV